MTENVTCVASKHGVVSCVRPKLSFGMRVNVVAPFITPMKTTAGFDESSTLEAGQDINTPI